MNGRARSGSRSRCRRSSTSRRSPAHRSCCTRTRCTPGGARSNRASYRGWSVARNAATRSRPRRAGRAPGEFTTTAVSDRTDGGTSAVPAATRALWCARLTGEGQPVEVRRKEGVTNHFRPESCAGRCEAAGEALTGARTGRAIEHRKRERLERRDCHSGRRQHRHHRNGEGMAGSTVSENPCTFVRPSSGPGRSSFCPGSRTGAAAGRRIPYPMMHGMKKGAALLRRGVFALFMGLFARGCVSPVLISGGQQPSQRVPASFRRPAEPRNGTEYRRSVPLGRAPFWTFARRSGTVPWAGGQTCDGCDDRIPGT